MQYLLILCSTVNGIAFLEKAEESGDPRPIPSLLGSKRSPVGLMLLVCTTHQEQFSGAWASLWCLLATAMKHIASRGTQLDGAPVICYA